MFSLYYSLKFNHKLHMVLNINALADVKLSDLKLSNILRRYEFDDNPESLCFLFSLKKLAVASCQRHGLAVPRAGDRSCVTGSIHGWSRSHLTYITGDC